MVKLYEDGIYLRGGSEVVPAAEAAELVTAQQLRPRRKVALLRPLHRLHESRDRAVDLRGEDDRNRDPDQGDRDHRGGR